MRITILIILFYFLSACSSSSKKTSDDPPENKYNESLIEEPGVPSKTSKKEAAQNTTTESSSAKKQEPSKSSELNQDNYSALSGAIKNQDEDLILKEGSKILMQNQNDIKALNAMGMVYYKKGQFSLSKNLLLRAIKAGPTYELYSNLGIVYLAIDEKNEAVKNFKKALELNPSDAVSASNLGSIYVKAHDYEKAVMALDIVYKRGTRDFKVLNNYAVSLVAVGKYEKADQIYKEALKENSNSKEVLFNYSILLIEHLNRYQEGLENIQKLKFIGIPEDSRTKIQALEQMARKEQK